MLRYTYTACLVHFYVSSCSFHSLNCFIRGEIGSTIILSYTFTGWLNCVLHFVWCYGLLFLSDVMDFVEHKNDDDDNHNNNLVITTLIILIFLFSYFTREVKSPHFSLRRMWWRKSFYIHVIRNIWSIQNAENGAKTVWSKKLRAFYFWKIKKTYKFQVIRRSIQELRNGLITFIFVIVCCCCLQTRPNSNPCKGSKVSCIAGTLFRIACRRVSECSWISGISWKRHRRSYDFILGNKNKSQGANLNHKEEWGNTAMISAAKNCCCSDTSSVHRRTVMVN